MYWPSVFLAACLSQMQGPLTVTEAGKVQREQDDQIPVLIIGSLCRATKVPVHSFDFNLWVVCWKAGTDGLFAQMVQ